MKIQKGDNFSEIVPRGTFLQKLNTTAKTVGYKVVERNNQYEVIKKRSIKKRLINSFLPFFIKNKLENDVLITFKWGTKNSRNYINKLGFKKKTNNYYYTSRLYSDLSIKKITKENLVIEALKLLIEDFYNFQISFSDRSEPTPLHSIIFKFI